MKTPPAKAGKKFFGKYRGKVLDNLDPLFQGRLMAEVPAIPGSLLNWALPCTPYAGPNVGFYAIPPIGASVWVEFEAGDPNYPIWAGCFWAPEDVLHTPDAPVPDVKVFQTDCITMTLSDLPETGGFTLKCNPAAVDLPLTLVFNSAGITITCPDSTVTITPQTVTLSVPDASVSLAPDAITLATSTSSVEVTPQALSLAVPTTSIALTKESLEVTSTSVSLDAQTLAVQTPAISVTGQVTQNP